MNTIDIFFDLTDFTSLTLFQMYKKLYRHLRMRKSNIHSINKFLTLNNEQLHSEVAENTATEN